MSFLDKRGLLLGLLLSLFLTHALSHEPGGKLLDLLTIVLVESHVVVADEVVTFLSARLRSLAVAVFQPCEHRLADMYATVVDDVGLHHLVATRLEDL